LALDSERLPDREPIRMCVGCRVRATKSELLRVTAVGQSCQPDPRAQHQGRGAYVHPTAECVGQAIKRRAFPRALRVTAGLEMGPLLEWIGSSTIASPDDASVSAQMKERLGMSAQ
jgi:uncharacterized protein